MTGIRDTAATDRVLDATPRRRRRMMIAGGVVGALIIGGLLAAPTIGRWSDSERSVSAQRLRFGTVEQGRFIRDISAQGRVVAAISPTLFSPEQGTVTLLVAAGETVTEGQVLAQMDSPILSSQLQQEHSTIESLQIEVQRQRISTRQQNLENQQQVDLAEVRIRAAERELRRAEQSYEYQVISLQDLEKAQDDLATAQLEHQHAVQDARLTEESLAFELQTRELSLQRQRLQVADLERRVAELQVVSPVSGIVGNLAVNTKDSVAANQPLMTVVDLSAFEVEIQVPETYADDLGLGMGTEIAIGTERFPGSLSSISPEVQGGQVTARMRFDDGLPEGLRQNQRVTARIVMDLRESIVQVPRGPFYDSGAGRVAYVVVDGIAERRDIVTGATSLGSIEIVSGLEPGEQIILSNLQTLQGAERVLITD